MDELERKNGFEARTREGSKMRLQIVYGEIVTLQYDVGGDHWSGALRSDEFSVLLGMMENLRPKVRT